MPLLVPTTSLIRRLTAFAASASLLLSAGAGAANAATAGVVPPRNPAADCGSGSGSGLGAIDSCRAAEGIGPLVLPSNFSSLSPAQQGFVVIDLERVNRGLPPILGLSGPLNALASAGASAGTDPNFPAGGASGGGIWAGAYSVLQADYLWMYVDGPGGNNLDCTAANNSGCWGHRDIILWDRTDAPLVSGGGFATAGGTDSLAYLVLSGYPASNLTFTWAGELRYFAAKPGIEPLGKAARAGGNEKKKHRRHHKGQHATVTASSGASGPSSGSSSSDSGPTITIG